MICRLVSAPSKEAAEIIEKLRLKDERTLRMSLFSLQKFIRVKSSHVDALARLI